MMDDLLGIISGLISLLRRISENHDTILGIFSRLLDVFEILAEHPEILEKILEILKRVLDILATAT